jgi:ferric-dicitrate binding protein FerR (iron transport regulator)
LKKELLEKFRSGSASSEELQLLYGILKKENDQDIQDIIDQEWDGIAQYENSPVSEGILQKIHDKISTTAVPKPSSSRILTLRRVLQYAAVFTGAFLISWFLKPAPSASLAKSSPVKENFFKIKVPYGSKTTIELPDSSKVVLNSGSSLEYPDHFGDNERTVILHGEAYFDVKKNRQKPFYVKTSEATIKVLGTQFNVKAYPGENTMETTLVSGSVEILPNEKTYDKKRQAYKRILLKPNEKVVFMHDVMIPSGIKEGIEKPVENKTLTAIIASQEAERTETDIAWKNDILILSNEPLQEIIKKLERWYNVQITLNGEQLANVRFSARFRGESISEVLYALSMTQPFNYTIDKSTIKIRTFKN